MPDYQVPSLESAISGPLNFDPICPDENIGTDRRIRKPANDCKRLCFCS